MFHALLGEPGAKGRDHLLQQDNNGLNLGLRMSEWKLLRLRNKGTSKAVVSKKKRPDADGPYRLYHLPEDAAETKDLSAANLEKLKEMIAKMDEIVAAPSRR